MRKMTPSTKTRAFRRCVSRW